MTGSHSPAFERWIEQARAVHIEDELARRGVELNGKVERDGPCPKCGGDDRFSINTRKQVFNCRMCKIGGDVIELVRHLDGVDFIEACTTLAGPPPATNGKDAVAPTVREILTSKHPYCDESGAVLFAVGRYEYQYPDGSFVVKNGKHKKEFKQKRPDPNNPGKWINNVNGVRVVPYKVPELIEAISNDHSIVIVEGEAKVDFLHTWNIPATCNAMGAGKWKTQHAEFLRDANVVILPDNDALGRNHADLVAASLQGIAKSMHVLELPGLGPKQDIIDWAKQGGTVEQLYELIAQQAKPWVPPNTDSATNNSSTAEAIMSKTYAPVKYVVPGVFVEGLTLFAGKPKVGKSWFLLHAAVAVGRGSFTLGEIKCPEGDVLYCALEDNERRLQSRMRKLFGYDWPGTPRLTFRCEMPRLAEGGIAAIEQWIASVSEPRLIIIDTLAMVRAPKKRDQSNYEADYAAGQELRALANRCGIAIVLVHHLRKADSDDPYDLISGTLGLTGVPDSVLVLKQDAKGYTLHGRGRDLMEIEKAMTFNTNDSCLWVILGNAGEVRRSNERGAILDAVEEAGEPLGPKEIAVAIGVKPVNVRKLLAKLATEGKIEKVEYGKYALKRAAAAA
jgi:hypothetical protein